MKKILFFTLICLIAAFQFTGCGGNEDNKNEPDETADEASFYDGQYHAEYGRYDVRNWKAYIDITIKDSKITKAYYDYTNENGEKRSENKGYIEGFSGANDGMTPREAFDRLGSQLVEKQEIQDVDVVSGATHSSRNFFELASAALKNAAAGNDDPAIIALYEDGTYKVEADAFDKNGWKPFVEVTVADDKITAVTFDYTNESGGLKTADAEYKANMEKQNGTYPEKYTTELEQQLIEKQIISQVDAISGATTSSKNFVALVEYALDDMAEVGETKPYILKLETEE